MVKNSPANAGDASWISGLRRFPGEGNGNPFQYSMDNSMENSMDKEGWWATVHGVAKSRTQLSDYHFQVLFKIMIDDKMKGD